jgi:class 3 adenylate cyclase/pimeloyl-ACP methyl ester carboxylesterase
MAEAPMGTVTLLFTDLERSTEMLQELGDDEARVVWRDHFRLLRNAVATRGGYEVKNLGDGLMVVFGSALDALACSVAMQQSVHRHNREQAKGRRLSVRVGLHIGEPIRDQDDYFGTPVVMAKRLCDQASGGQILTSDLVRRLVGSRGGYRFGSPETVSLKGVTEPLPVYEVLWQPADEGAEGQLPLPPLVGSGERTVFVGRERELGELRREWETVRGGQRRLVLLAGDPGIGKTRLALEFALSAHAEGATVLLGRSDEGAAVPCQPFVEALRHYVLSCPTEELRRQLGGVGSDLAGLLPELAQRLPEVTVSQSVGGEVEIRRLRDAIRLLLAGASRVQPMVFVLDDLHLADQQTVQMLRETLRSGEDKPLLVLGTYREAEVSRSHPLSEMLANVARDRAFGRVALPGLDEADVGEMIDSRAGEGAPEEFVQAVRELTEGNPFFIEEVLRHLAESGVIYERRGRWATRPGIDQMGLPEGLREVLGRRLSRLSEECNSILTIASVIGREFDLESLERASDIAGGPLLDLLEEAVAAKVVDETAHMVGRYRFSHALIYEALYEELTTTRRVRLHGQTLRYADSDGVKLAYEVLGSVGPHVVMIGLTSCPSVRSRVWTVARRFERVTRSCRLILYDRRGVGFSAAPEEGYGIEECVEDLRAILDAVGAERVVLWGATDGGPLAISFAAQYPERVAGLLLMGTTPKLSSWGEFQLGINPAVIESFLRLDAVDRGRATSEVTRTRHYRAEDAEAIGEVIRRVPRAAWSQIFRALSAADARPLLGQVRVPTLIVHDPENAYIPAEAARYMHGQIADSELEITEEYGPEGLGDTLFRRLAVFIEEVSSGGHQHR